MRKRKKGKRDNTHLKYDEVAVQVRRGKVLENKVQERHMREEDNESKG